MLAFVLKISISYPIYLLLVRPVQLGANPTVNIPCQVPDSRESNLQNCLNPSKSFQSLSVAAEVNLFETFPNEIKYGLHSARTTDAILNMMSGCIVGKPQVR